MSNVAGIGVDIVEVARMKTAIDARKVAFTAKMFTEREIAYCSSKKSPYQHYAARFAAKEAVAKAMHTGWSGVFRWKDVEVVNEPSGEPRVVLHGKVASALSGSKVHLSISHTETTVVAFALIEKS